MDSWIFLILHAQIISGIFIIIYVYKSNIRILLTLKIVYDTFGFANVLFYLLVSSNLYYSLLKKSMFWFVISDKDLLKNNN